MGLFGTQEKVSRNTVFSLTPTGKTKAEDITNDPKSRVLVALDELGAANIDEISNESRIRKGRLQVMLKVLLRGGYIHVVRGEE